MSKVYTYIGIGAVFLFGGWYGYFMLEQEVSLTHLLSSITAFFIPSTSVSAYKGHESLLFVGDVMLARKVETYMSEKGASYPLSLIGDYLKSNTFVFGNFEGAIPVVHEHTPDLTFQFSVDPQFVPILKANGFTDMTLANNHAYDYGYEGHTNAVEVLKTAGIGAHGSPSQITKDDIAYVTIDSVHVAVVPIYGVEEDVSMNAFKEVFAEASAHSDFQIVSVHWGEEYSKQNTLYQQKLAHAFIDMGVDAVIGHHPHVVENIEVYKGAPIFYSLGNFIFDQYWYEEVKTGLVVRLQYHAPNMQYTLVPVYSKDLAPERLEGEARQTTLNSLSDISDTSLRDAVLTGVFELKAPFLAIGPQ